MEIKINTRFLSLELDESSNTLVSIWETKADMREEDYRNLFLKYMEAVQQTKPQNIIIDALNARYPISVELQHWINSMIFPVYEKLAIKKMAIIMSEDFIAQLSFEQVAEQIELPGFEISYFVNINKALTWITE